MGGLGPDPLLPHARRAPALRRGRPALADPRRPGRRPRHAAVSQIRRKLNAGRGETGWYQEIEQSERDALRPLGRRLVELVGEYIAADRPRSEIETEVDEIGRHYGELLVERGTPLLRAMEAFTFFRRSLDETAKQMAERNRMDAGQAAEARERIGGLADRVLLGVSAAYDGG